MFPCASEFFYYRSYVEDFLTISTAVKVVVNRDSDEEFRLSDVTSGDGDSPQVEPTPEGGLLTPQSNTLGTSTLDSDAGRPVSDVAHFFKGFENEDGLVMRQCDECL